MKILLMQIFSKINEINFYNNRKKSKILKKNYLIEMQVNELDTFKKQQQLWQNIPQCVEKQVQQPNTTQSKLQQNSQKPIDHVSSINQVMQQTQSPSKELPQSLNISQMIKTPNQADYALKPAPSMYQYLNTNHLTTKKPIVTFNSLYKSETAQYGTSFKPLSSELSQMQERDYHKSAYGLGLSSNSPINPAIYNHTTQFVPYVPPYQPPKLSPSYQSNFGTYTQQSLPPFVNTPLGHKPFIPFSIPLYPSIPQTTNIPLIFQTGPSFLSFQSQIKPVGTANDDDRPLQRKRATTHTANYQVNGGMVSNKLQDANSLEILQKQVNRPKKDQQEQGPLRKRPPKPQKQTQALQGSRSLVNDQSIRKGFNNLFNQSLQRVNNSQPNSFTEQKSQKKLASNLYSQSYSPSRRKRIFSSNNDRNLRVSDNKNFGGSFVNDREMGSPGTTVKVNKGNLIYRTDLNDSINDFQLKTVERSQYRPGLSALVRENNQVREKNHQISIDRSSIPIHILTAWSKGQKL